MPRYPFIFFLTFILLLTSVLFAGEKLHYFKPGETHYDNDELLQQYYTGNPGGALNEMKKQCSRRRNGREYFCYNVAVLQYYKGQKSDSWNYLRQAMRANEVFPEAINLALILGKLPEQEGVAHYEQARRYARAGNYSAALESVEKAIEKGWGTRELYLNQPDFTKLKEDSRFIKTVNLVGETDIAQIEQGYENQHPLHGIVDPYYTYWQHLKEPDKTMPMFSYYEGLRLAKSNPTASGRYLKEFLDMLSGRDRDLAARAVLFVWQEKRFAAVRSSSFKSYLIKEGRKNGLPSNWEKKL